MPHVKKSASSAAVDWAAIRPLYEDVANPLSEVAKKAGVTWQAISHHAARNGWKLRKAPRKPDAKAAELAGAALMPSKLAVRLKRLIAREIESIEGEAARDRDAVEKERDARRLSSLVRSLEKLNDIKAAKAKRDPKANDDDGDALRAELERRLARLAAGTGAGGVSRQPDAEGDGVAR